MEAKAWHAMNYLFICTKGLNRGPTAEKVFCKLLKESRKKGEVKSAGVAQDAPNPVSHALLIWADKIFCMEEEHKLYITYLYPELEQKIEVLNIPDQYQKDDPELIQLLTEKLKNLI